MPWRKWFVRSLVFSIIGASVGVAVIYQRWTDPATVREMVLAKLQEMYPGAVITVDSARLRILGGIQINELRMSRRDDPDRTEFFHVPSAVIYHDKEKISQGLLTLRKIELHHPRLRAVKRRDGTWNLQDILGDRPTNVVQPTTVIHHGTIVLEDENSALPSTYLAKGAIEINDLCISFINDPINIVTIVGSANSSVLGTLQLNGIIRRDIKEFELKLKTIGTTVGPALMQHVVCACPSVAELAIDAKVDVDASLTHRWDLTEPPDFTASLNVTGGRVRHPRLPLPLDDIRASIECSNGAVRIDNFTARSNQALLKGWASAQLPCPEQSFETELELQHLHVDDDLTARLGEKVHFLQQIYHAKGPATVRVVCARRDGKWVHLSNGAESSITLVPEGDEANFKYFKYPLSNVTGTIKWFPESATTDVNVTAYAKRRPITIHGSWQGYGDQAKASFDVAVDEVPIEPALIAALPEQPRELTNAFRPTGIIGLRANFKRLPGSTDFRHEYHLHLHDGTVCWKEFPLPLEQVSGFLDIYPGKWSFHDGRGRHGDGEVEIEGKSVPAPLRFSPDATKKDSDGLELKIIGREIALDHPDMRKAVGVMPQLGKAMESFRPRGKLNFGARVDMPPGRPEDVNVAVNVDGAAIQPQFFSYLISDIKGQFRYFRNRLDAINIKARHYDTRLEMNHAAVYIQPGGAHFTQFDDLRIHQLRADQDLLQALPKTLHSFTESLELSRPVDILLGGDSPGLIVRQSAEPGSAPDIWWNGQMFLRDTQFSAGVTLDKVDGVVGCRGEYDGRSLKWMRGNMLFNQATLFKQRFQKVVGHFEVDEKFPERLNVGLNAPIFGGNVTGQARLDMTSAMPYGVDLSFSHIDLQQFGAHNLGQRAQLQGLMEGRLYLWGFGSSAETLDGDGTVDVNHGRLYNLPLLLDLLKFLGLRLPDRTAFEELHANFSIHGSRVRARKLKLIGNAISLIGAGDFNLDGTDLNIDFVPSWGHIDSFAWFRDLSQLISKNILVIEVRGKVDSNPDDLKFNKRIVPLVSDRFRELNQILESR